MCGLAGALVFQNSNFRINPSYIINMRDTMIHRGPDNAGLWMSEDSKIGLGHRRLKIIDLSDRANQPMCNEDGSLWVIFNGEIYNHRQIRTELEKTSKHIWKTDHSDTEVILHAFEEWGIDCLRKFRGMFAIALWDAKNKQLWLIRDRIGIKPLYYSIHNGRITFASEIKALLKDPDQKRAVNEEALYHYLSFLCVPAPETMFEGIKKVPAGTWLKVEEDGLIYEHRYWDVWDYTQPLLDAEEEQIAKMLLDELRIAVKLRKIADVDIGVFLSGGIDSSTNAALFSEDETRPIKIFTIGYSGEYQSYQNELNYAKRMAREVGAEYHERLLSLDDLLDFLPQMVYLQDEPIADPVCVPIYYVSKLARENGVIACQVGEGADELFWGYPEWKTLLQIQRFDDLPVSRIIKKAALLGLRISGKSKYLHYEWLRRGILGQPIFWSGAEAFTETQKKELLSPRLRKKFLNLTSWEVLKPIRKRFEQKAWEKTHLNWMTYVDLNLRLPELLLMRIDKMSMGVSLEGRVPFLDHKFVELAMGIPQKTKTKNNTLKYIFKKAVRGVIPDEFIYRKKQGFNVPVREWYFNSLGEKIGKEVNDFCNQTDFFDKTRCTNIIGKRDGKKAWYLLNLALWWKKYIRGAF